MLQCPTVALLTAEAALAAPVAAVADVMAAVVAATVAVGPPPRAAGVAVVMAADLVAVASVRLAAMAVDLVAAASGRLVTTDSTEAVSTNTATGTVVRNAKRVTVITQPTAAKARLALARTINGSSTVAMAVQASSPADSVAAVPPDSVIAPAVFVPAGADNGSQAPSIAIQCGPRRSSRVGWAV